MKDEAIRVVVDVGSSKIRVTMACLDDETPLEILASTFSVAAPLRKGVISDLRQVGEAVREALMDAEAEANFNIKSVTLAVGGSDVLGVNSDAVIAVRSGVIREEDVNEAIRAARTAVEKHDYEILHILPQQYIVDEHQGIVDPIGMAADRLEARVHVVAVKKTTLENLKKCVESAGVSVKEVIFSGLAACESALTDDERDMGVCLVDIGAGTTEIMLWRQYQPVHSAVLHIGGEMVSSDIAMVLKTPRPFAEMLKCQYGSVRQAMVKAAEVPLPSTGHRQARSVSSREIVEIMATRYEELFEMLEQELHRAGLRHIFDGGIVLTGGAAQVPGLAEMAADYFHVPARMAKPEVIAGMPEHIQHDPGMMVSLGLVQLDYMPLEDHVWAKPVKNGILARVKDFFSRF